ncbi:NAD-dependent dehydratase [Lentzea guizhouensis]|uniref:NAD-dependent dehydratase n=1 Tax=Lentzea guizhouensis TaxID=1586287 RepID=A0A1B2HS10_9PSEU|nr:SDR family oxidoreductase [Lentzea guizhouensis]ANZ40509.1 NAD-dependent dehydratase [Lentzea guizhouensis]
MTKLNVLVTGASGYLGSVLVTELDRRGHRVIGIDNGLVARPSAPLVNGEHLDADLRDVSEWASVLDGVDAVIHLAAIVGDPACGLDENLTWETNYLGTVRLAEACRRHGVSKFVFASTCSNYGMSVEDAVEAGTPLHPHSVYAESKVHSEHHLLANADGEFSPRILRLSTLYGVSSRMRFDLAVNVMTAHAVRDRRITVFGGEQWRPFLHIADAADALIRAAELDRVDGMRIWNCGSEEQTYPIAELARMIAGVVPGTEVHVETDSADLRNYRVNFSRMRTTLAFTPRRDLVDAVRSIADRLLAGQWADPAAAEYVNVELVRTALRDAHPAAGTTGGHRWPQLSFDAA